MLQCNSFSKPHLQPRGSAEASTPAPRTVHGRPVSKNVIINTPMDPVKAIPETVDERGPRLMMALSGCCGSSRCNESMSFERDIARVRI